MITRSFAYPVQKVIYRIPTYSFDVYATPGQGAEMEDGQFNGAMGELQREERDVYLPAGMSVMANKVVHYFKSHDENGLCIITLKPTFLPQNLLLLRPFEGTVYLDRDSRCYAMQRISN